MFCKSCGSKIDNDSQFCSYCGTKQSETNKPAVIDSEHYQENPKSFNTNISSSKRSQTDQETNKTQTEPKYDSTYLEETEATTIGVTILISSLLLLVFQPVKFDNIDSHNQFRAIFSILALILRIFITFWVINIAKKQNRETFGWGFFAFCLPSIALIIIGKQKKIFAKFEVDNSLSNEENSLILTKRAQTFLNEKKFNECIRFTEKAIEFDINNKKASDLLVKARLQIPVSEVSNKHTQVVFRETVDKQILKIVSKNYQSIGASVFINEKIAPDGEYIYLNESKKLKIKDGKIELITVIN
jgi:hypothetical protein